MRRTRLISFRPFLALALALGLGLALASVAGAVTVGEKAPAFTLEDLDGESHSLSDFAGKTVVLEWINPNCPFSLRHSEEGTMAELAKRPDVVFLAINSTNPEHKDFLKPAAHKAFMDEHDLGYGVLYDPTGEVGKAYDAKTTPHMYVIDGEGTLVYNGAIDDDPPGRKAMDDRANYVDGALVAQAANRSVDPATTKPYGCSVKY